MVVSGSGTASAAGLASGVSNVEVIALATKDTFTAQAATFRRRGNSDFAAQNDTSDFIAEYRGAG